MAYYLTCPDCAYTEIVSELEDAMSRKEQHESAFGDGHTVAFGVIEDQPMFRGGVSDDWE